jgi:LUD domain
MSTDDRSSWAGHEHGDRHAFLARAFTKNSRPTSPNVAHPLPPSAEGADGFAPISYTTVDSTDLVGSFLAGTKVALLESERFDGLVTDAHLLGRIQSDNIRTAVVSKAPRAIRVGEQLSRLGVDVVPYSRRAAIPADLGVTSPVFGIAATGSLVQDSNVDGARGGSLVPRLHLAVLAASDIVPTTADVLATFRKRGMGNMPANVVFITGPSRTGDIEMILTVGVHGPTRVFVVVEAGN